MMALADSQFYLNRRGYGWNKGLFNNGSQFIGSNDAGNECSSVMSIQREEEEEKEEEDDEECLEGGAFSPSLHQAKAFVSSCSISEMSSLVSASEDEFDRLTSHQTRKLFDEIDSALYKENDDCTATVRLTTECYDWALQFPHLRLIGRQIGQEQDNGYRFYSPTKRNDSSRQSSRENTFTVTQPSTQSSNLSIFGTSISLGFSSSGVSRRLHNSSPVGVDDDEEIIEQNGTIEEIIAVDYGPEGDENCRRTAVNRSRRGLPPLTPRMSDKENVKAVLRDCLLKEVFSKISLICRRLLPAYSSDVKTTGRESTTERFSILAGPADFSSQTIRTSSLVPYRIDIGEDRDSFDQSNHLLTDRGERRLGSFGASGQNRDVHFNGLLTVASKALITREKTITSNDGQLDGPQNAVASSNTRPNSSTSYYRPLSTSHQTERAKTLNRPTKMITTEPLPTTRLLENRLRTEVLRGHGLITNVTEPVVELSVITSTSIPSNATTTSSKMLPSITQQRDIMSATNTNINRTIPTSKRYSVRSISALHHDKDTITKFPLREKASTTIIECRPSTITSQRAEPLYILGRRSATLVPGANYSQNIQNSVTANPRFNSQAAISWAGLSPAHLRRPMTNESRALNIMGSSIMPHDEKGTQRAALIEIGRRNNTGETDEDCSPTTSRWEASAISRTTSRHGVYRHIDVTLASHSSASVQHVSQVTTA